MTSTPDVHHIEIEIVARDAKGNESSVPLELASSYADTPQKAAEVSAKLLTGQSNGGMGRYTRVTASED